MTRPRTPDEFKTQLDRLRDVVTRALAYYTVWKVVLLHDKAKAGWPIEDQNKVLGRFKGFFTPVGVALLEMAMVEFAKSVDKDNRTVSLPNLLAAARSDPRLVSLASAEDLREAASLIQKSNSMLATLKRKRDQELAHADVTPPTGEILTGDMDDFAEVMKSTFNTLSIGVGQGTFSWEFALRQSEQCTRDVIGALLNAVEGWESSHEDEMVEIGLAELRKEGELLGAPLAPAAAQTLLDSLGLTEEECRRAREAYLSSAKGGVQ